MDKIRLLVVSNNPLLHEGIQTTLKPYKEISVSASVGEKESLSSKVRRVKPQVGLFDADLKKEHFRVLLDTLTKQSPGAEAIVMNVDVAEKDILGYIRSGVSGFVVKGARRRELLTAIRTVAEGTKLIPPPLTEQLFYQIEKGNGVDEEKPPVCMTDRELEIIELIKQGLRDKEIAKKLKISPETVGPHVHNILLKLSLHKREQLLSFKSGGNFPSASSI